MSNELLRKLEERLGPLHARQRLEIERDHEAQVFGQDLKFFHLENWYSAPAIIRTILKLTGLYWRARRNAENIRVKRNDLIFAELPSEAFDGFTILHISNLHADMNEVAMGNLIQLGVVPLTSNARCAGGPKVPCVDGSGLAREIFTSQAWSVQPCVRPVDAVHMTAGHTLDAGIHRGCQTTGGPCDRS